MKDARFHVIGAGLAGLAAALTLATRGCKVTLHEAAAQGGGRCRSYREPALGCLIDNGNHLLLSGNEMARAYLAEIGSDDALTGPADARFLFLDLGSGKRWAIRPSGGAIPWWILDRTRRVPETTPLDYLTALKLATAGPEATVAERVGNNGALYRHFWEPLTLAVLNTEPQAGAASLLWRVLKDSFGRGAMACRPLVAREGLGPAFVEPAMKHLAKLGVEIGFNRRLRALERSERRVTQLTFADGAVTLNGRDGVVLAVTPAAARELLPDLPVPEESRPIVNAHFLLPEGFLLPTPFDGGSPFLGLFGGTAQWLFLRGSVASVTVSAASALVDLPAENLALHLWRDVARALGLDLGNVPSHRVIKEKRATFAATPAACRKRPAAKTALGNLWLAGDWTATGYPATVEGAIRSGRAAAEAALQFPV